MLKNIVLTLAAILVLAALVFAAAPDLSGTWTGTTNVDQSEDSLTLVLALKDGAYSGTLTDTLGFCTESALRNVAFKDGALDFDLTISDGQDLHFALKLDGGKLIGPWTTSGGTTGEAILEREK